MSSRSLRAPVIVLAVAVMLAVGWADRASGQCQFWCFDDIILELVHPDGTSMFLIPPGDGSSSCGFVAPDFLFDDEAAVPYMDGGTQSGPVRPIGGLLSVFDGKPLPGTWQLRISDDCCPNEGNDLDNWSLSGTVGGVPFGPIQHTGPFFNVDTVPATVLSFSVTQPGLITDLNVGFKGFCVVPNTPPTVTITSPPSGTTVNFGTGLTFTGTASDAEDGDLTGSISWSSSIDGALGTGGSVGPVVLSIGTHTITASVTDSGGLSASDAITVTVLNNPPTVTITGPPDGTTVNLLTLLTFTGVASDFEDGDLTGSIGWSSSLDGPFGVGSPVMTAGLTVGVHTITASVTDSMGATASDSITVTIETNAPDGVNVGHTTSGTLRQGVAAVAGDVCTVSLWVGKRSDGLGTWGYWYVQLFNGSWTHTVMFGSLASQSVEWQQYEKTFTVPAFLTGALSLQLTGYYGWESYDLVSLDCSSGELVTNGSFEDPVIPDGQWSTAFGNPPPGVWSCIGGAGHFNPNTTQFNNFVFP